VVVTNYYSGDRIKEDNMGGACGMYEGRREPHVEFRQGNLKERDHLEDKGVDERMVLNWILNWM
jgi:hypothetical protein